MKRANHAGRPVFVVKLNKQAKPGEKASKTLKRFRTVRQAEKYIGEIAKQEPGARARRSVRHRRAGAEVQVSHYRASGETTRPLD